jgi:Alpha-L-arabinofuranosidase B, catalytic
MSSSSSAAFQTTLTAAPLVCTGRLLDKIPRVGTPIALAFSTRKVSTAYRGACLRVRRTSDNREQDIGFVQTDLDYESMLTFAAGFDAYVSVWYDQSGRGRHARQMDPALQPQIVRNGELVMDKNSNQISMRFNGAYLNTTWEPTPAEVAGGVGIQTSASIGLDNKSVQSGTATRVSSLLPGVTVQPEYPSPLLPEGHDLFLLEGHKVIPDGTTTEIVYTSGGNLTHLTVNATTDNFSASVTSDVIAPSGPAVVTVDTLNTGVTPQKNQWRRGIKLGGRIFAVPSNSDKILEIKYATGIPTEQRVVVHNLPAEFTQAGQATVLNTNKFWMAVATSANIGYCIPANAQYVLKINAADPTTPEFTPLGLGSPGAGLSSLGILDNKWHEAAAVNGRVYAVPHNASQMLVINSATDEVSYMTNGPALATSSAMFSAVAVSGDKVIGVPWNAATFFVANTATNAYSLQGGTGITAYIANSSRQINHGNLYIDPPTLTVSAPNDPTGNPLVLNPTLVKTRTVTSVTMTNQGSGYVSSPSVSWSIGNIRHGLLPSSPKPGVEYTSGGVTVPATMALVDPLDPSKGYKITGIRLTYGGHNLPPEGGGNPTLVIGSDGKGSFAGARAVVVNGQVILVNVFPPGSGYTSIPDVKITGGGGTGANAYVTGITPIEYTFTNGILSHTGGSIISIAVDNPGSGYRSLPTVSIGVAADKTGKGTAAAGVPVLEYDGQVTRIDVTGGGSGYSVESSTGASVVEIDPPQRAGGVRATAYISEVAGGAITKITVSNCGCGYTATPQVRITTGTATAVATFETDGWLSATITNGTPLPTKYAIKPTVQVSGGLGPRDGARDGTNSGGMARHAVISLIMDGECSGSGRSPYIYGGAQTSGNEKFLATFVPLPKPDKPNPNVYAFPYWTHRIVEFNPDTNVCTDIKANPNGANFTPTRAQHAAGTSVTDSSGNQRFYAIPYTGRKQLIRFTVGTGADILPTTYNGAWNQGIYSPASRNIYCVPANTKSMLVIDTKQDSKSEMVTFANVRGNDANKWWGAVLAGESDAEGLIFGIPGDVDTILELNPGVALRRKNLPAPGLVLNDQKSILFAPSLQNDGNRAMIKYDTETKTAQSIPVPSGNVTYVEGVQLADGNVIFVPSYNQTDPFVYTGNIGIYDPNAVTNPFRYSATRVPIGNAAPFPSRTATALGGTASKLVSWVPREGLFPMMVYDFKNDEMTNVADLGQRVQTKVDVATARLVGDPATSQQVVVAQPSLTQIGITASPAYPNYGTDEVKFMGGVLTRQNVIVLAPGLLDYFVLFYPDRPSTAPGESPLGVTYVEGGSASQRPTRINPPPSMLAEFNSLPYYSAKFSGALYDAVTQKVYCVPLNYWRIVVVDPLYYSVTDFGDLSTEPGGAGYYWGGCQGGDGKFYFTPYNAQRILVVDPSVENPSARISYIDLPPSVATGTGKWRGGALANDGRIFCAPYNSASVLIIDPVNKTSYAPGGLAWLSGSAKFCEAVKGADNNIYFMPAGSPYIVGLDPINTTSTTLFVIDGGVIDTQIGAAVSFDRWSAACSAPNGRIYTVPHAHAEALEFDVRSQSIERFGGSTEYFLGNTRDDARWRCIVPARDGNLYAFPSDFSTILKYTPEQTRAYVWNRGAQQWLTTGAMDGPYRLRPFLLDDQETVVFHTSGRRSYVMYNVKNVDANTSPIVGPGVQEGIAAHFPEAGDRILIANVGNVISLTPFQGGIGGVKSFSGTADLYVGTDGPDLNVAIGANTIGIRNVLNTLLANAEPGAYSAHAAAGSLTLYLRDTPLGGTSYTWDGQVGNTFSVGCVQGSEVPALGVPASRTGFNGLISELVVFQSDQDARATSLGENTAFYYLDSKIPLQV